MSAEPSTKETTTDAIPPIEIPKLEFGRCIPKDRLLSLSDGVFAVALTLIVLDFKIPPATEINGIIEDTRAILNTYWQFIPYFLIVSVLGKYWSKHLRIFALITHVDPTISFFNILFLLFMSFTPFTLSLTRWLTPFYMTLTVCLNITLMGVSLLFIWIYATFRRGFVPPHPHLSMDTILLMYFDLCLSITISLIALAVSPASVFASIGVLAIIPLIHFLTLFRLDANRSLFNLIKRIFTSCCGGSHEYVHSVFVGTREHLTQKLTRVKCLSDAVFAVVMTILVLQIKPPEPGGGETTSATEGTNAPTEAPVELSFIPLGPYNDSLGVQLRTNYQFYIAYVLSFIIIAYFWRMHAFIIDEPKRINKLFMILNFQFLGLVTLLPYGQNIITTWHMYPVGIVTYCIMFLLSSLLLIAVFLVAHFFIESDIPMRRRVLQLIRIVILSVTSIVALAVSFGNSYAGIAICLIVPLFEILASFYYLDVYEWIYRAIEFCYDKQKKRKAQLVKLEMSEI